MSISHLVCQYCSHHNAGADSRCAHCGAPLSGAGVAEAGHSMLTGAGRGASAVEHAVVGTAKAVADTGATAEAATVASGLQRLLSTLLPKVTWQVAAVALALMGILATVLIRSCSGGLPSMPGMDPLNTLPQSVRSAASCPQSGGDNCVIAGTDLLLSGGLTSGRALPLSVQVDSPDQLADTVRRWRAADPTVLVDGPVFVAIGPSTTAWYADLRTGLHIETGTFASRDAARTFLVRAGLIR
ncbi:hypothetical protein [Nocardia jiangxiensis]|uniref:hypothetical protein n=1 Tax=Nocardia jiangxiensis TaxID=282685 RepID=UPI000594C267|nr:hypothetical protein [Nocardia jiangxiensis]